MNNIGITYNNSIIGNYSNGLNREYLLGLGFYELEIEKASYIMDRYGKITRDLLLKEGENYEQANRIKYLGDIICGKIAINDMEELSKHLKKMWGTKKRLTINDLMLSKISKVPKKAVVAGIIDPTYKIFNSNNYQKEECMYEVIGVSSNYITVESNKKPVLKYKQNKEIPNILKIKELLPNGNIIVTFHRDYIKLCNRFVIIATLRRPEFHHGLIEIITIDGSRIYIYAKTIKQGEIVHYSGGTQRVYDYGFMGEEIEEKLCKSAYELYFKIRGVFSYMESANIEYNILSEDKDSKIGIEIEF